VKSKDEGGRMKDELLFTETHRLDLAYRAHAPSQVEEIWRKGFSFFILPPSSFEFSQWLKACVATAYSCAGSGGF
jgi:hypothetical protein